MKYFPLILLLILFKNPSYGFVVLIDPGHGGDEYGAVSSLRLKNSKGKYYTKKYYEKDLCLRLAKKVKRILDKEFTTYLTRSFDRKVKLEDRAEMAETVKADLFISIHFNSARDKVSNGFETYYLDNHKDVAIKKVEDIENKHLHGEDKIINQILIDLVIDKTVDQSKKVAGLIHGELNKRISKKFKMKNREIKPGLFYVLALSKRPGALIEAGFMSNPKELRKINSEKYLNSYAKAIASGVVRYYKTLPKKDVPLF